MRLVWCLKLPIQNFISFLSSEDFDMPQPLSRVAPKAESIKLGSTEHFEKHPDIALHAMKVIAAAVTIEAGFARIFVALMGTNPGPGVAMYLSLQADTARRSVLRAAAKNALSNRDAELFEALLAVAKTATKLRHKLAHWTWGATPDVTDGLLICDPTEYIPLSMKRVEWEKTVKSGAVPEELPRLPRDKIFVIKKGELNQSVAAIARVQKFILSFETIMLGGQHPSNTGDQEYNQLCSEPEVQSALVRLRGRESRGV
jgi:hypothetical protein